MPNIPDFETLFVQTQEFILSCNGEHVRYATDSCKLVLLCRNNTLAEIMCNLDTKSYRDILYVDVLLNASLQKLKLILFRGLQASSVKY